MGSRKPIECIYYILSFLRTLFWIFLNQIPSVNSDSFIFQSPHLSFFFDCLCTCLENVDQQWGQMVTLCHSRLTKKALDFLTQRKRNIFSHNLTYWHGKARGKQLYSNLSLYLRRQKIFIVTQLKYSQISFQQH